MPICINRKFHALKRGHNSTAQYVSTQLSLQLAPLIVGSNCVCVFVCGLFLGST